MLISLSCPFTVLRRVKIWEGYKTGKVNEDSRQKERVQESRGKLEKS